MEDAQKVPKRIEPKVAKYLAMALVFGIPLIYKDHAISENIQETAVHGIVAIWLGGDIVGLGFNFNTVKSKFLEKIKKEGADNA